VGNGVPVSTEFQWTLSNGPTSVEFVVLVVDGVGEDRVLGTELRPVMHESGLDLIKPVRLSDGAGAWESDVDGFDQWEHGACLLATRNRNRNPFGMEWTLRSCKLNLRVPRDRVSCASEIGEAQDEMVNVGVD